MQAHPPHPPSIWGAQGYMVGWHVLLLSCQLTCRRLPLTKLSHKESALNGQPAPPCQSHTVLNPGRLLVYRPISSSSPSCREWLGRLSGYCPARRCLSFSLVTNYSPLALHRSHLVIFGPPSPRAGQTPPSSIASLCVQGASTPLDQLCLPVWPVWASVGVSVIRQLQSCASYCRSTLSAGAHPTPRLFPRPSHYVTFHRVGRLLCCARRSLALLPRGLQGSRVETRAASHASVHARYPSAPPPVTADCRYPPAAACHSARCMHLPPSPHLLSADQIRSILPVRLAIWRV